MAHRSMVGSIAKLLLIALACLWIVGMLLLAITDPDVFHRHFYGETPFSPTALLAELWPRQILIAAAIAIAVLALTSEKVLGFIGLVRLHGNLLLSLISIVYALAIVVAIHLSGIGYPLRLDHDTIVILGFLLSGSALPLPIILISVNYAVARPANLAFVLVPPALLYFGVGIWLNFALTGEIDALETIRRICC